MSPATLGTPRRALIAPRHARRRALRARPCLRPHWGLITELSLLVAELSPLVAELSPLLAEISLLIAELSPIVTELSLLDHVSGHARDSSLSSHRSLSGSSPSSRCSTTSLVMLGTPRRALVPPHQARRRALITRPCLRPHRGLITELSPLVAKLSLSSRRSLPSSRCSSLSSRRSSLSSRRSSSPSSRRSNHVSSRARGLVWQTHLVSDHRAHYTPRPPDQCSGTASSTTRPVRLLDHPTSARGLPPRPLDQRSGTAPSTTRPVPRDSSTTSHAVLKDCFNHSPIVA
jgi:hypothetical protein